MLMLSIRQLANGVSKSVSTFQLAWHVVHMPLEAPAADLALQVNISNPNRRTIMAMVTTLDTGVGSVVDALKATQMFPNSVIVLTTDKCGATCPLLDRPLCAWMCR